MILTYSFFLVFFLYFSFFPLFPLQNDSYLEPDLERSENAGSLPGTGRDLISQFYKNKKTRGEEEYAAFEGDEEGGEGEEEEEDGPPVFEEFGEEGGGKVSQRVSMGVRSREIPHSSLQYVCPLGEGQYRLMEKNFFPHFSHFSHFSFLSF